MEVKRATFFEGELYLYDVMMRGKPAARGWYDDTFPDIRAEERSGYVCVLEREEGRGKGLELRSHLCWKIN